ncbi:hypothetical protein HD806DRAFT_545548 [Xylariaceae sp. AK1471]|nr:hypothetical protein HD806DRAFT_545548 [Xylariaceae sp. AK1471]
MSRPRQPAVRQVLQPLVEEGRKVIILMHSYSGIMGTNAVKGLARKDRQANNLPGGVVYLIYVAAFMLSRGQTIRTVVQAVNLTGRESLVKFEEDGTWFPMHPIWLLYQDQASEDQQEQLRLLKWGNSACLVGETTYEAWRDVPTLYVRSTEDRWLPLEFQEFWLKNADNARVPVSVSAVRSGHPPYIKFVDELAEMAFQVSGAI